MKTRGLGRFYWVKHGCFKLRITNHAVERAAERGGMTIAEVMASAGRVAEECVRWRDPTRRDDVFDLDVNGLLWRVMVHSKRRGTVLTVIPSKWRAQSHTMNDW